MNIAQLAQKLKYDKNIKGIIAIHLFGNSCDIINIKKLSKQFNCFLIEDSAQSFGNEIEAGKLGSFGDISIFSFGNGKIIEVGHGGSVQTNNKELMTKIQNEYKKLPKYDKNKIDKLSKYHRSIYYKLYYLGIKYPKLNILNLVYLYSFKSYYLYQLDEQYLELLMNRLKEFKTQKQIRVNIISNYLNELKKISNIKIPKLNNREYILSRFTVIINNSEKISKKIRDKNIPSNTMYPMLIDRFKLFFDKQEYSNSYLLKGKLLNLWSNDISREELLSTIKIIKDIDE
jgi:dTDP-4-amino-4,6-dideoxygalactose transaminase